MLTDAVHDAASALPGGEERAFRATSSLRHRLPLLILILLATTGGLLGWMAHRQVEEALRLRSLTLVADATREVANLLSDSAAARGADLARLADGEEVRTLLSAPPGQAAVPARLEALLARNPQTRLSIHDREGRVVYRFPATESGSVAPTHTSTTAAGFSPLYLREGRIWYQASAAVTAPPAPEPIGYVSVERPLSSGAARNLLERLVGHEAVMKLGNASGDLWTDFSSPAPAPPASLVNGSGRFVEADGDARLGAAVPVKNTPWLVWADISEREALTPADTLAKRMVPITLIVAVLAAAAVYTVTARVTTPLEHVASAAEAIASGDYARRVSVSRGDEIGQLAAAFNTMAARVSESRDTLEARVAARTEELEYARQELDQFFSLSLHLLSISSLDGTFRRVNPAWEQVLGWSASGLIGTSCLDLVHPDDRAAAEAETAKLAEGRPVLRFENRLRCKDNSYRWISWAVVPLVQRGLLYAVAYDVTDQKHAASELQKHAADLENANRELEAFSYSVSHDLRAPLRSIDGFAQALAEDYEDRFDETGRDYLLRIRAAAQRMGALIDDLLGLSRVTRAELNRTKVDVSSLVRDIASRLQEQEPGRRVEWSIAADVHVRADPALLRVALENLVGNAWKFTARQPVARIEFSTERDGDGRRVYVVRDNGAGFDMAHATKLFGAFQRLHANGEFPGTGIGLATVQRIVRRHGGRIRADAAVGRGASFYFTLS